MSAEKPKAVLFDLDDTIVAFDMVSEQCWQSICRRFAPRIEGIEAERLYTTINETRRWYQSDRERMRYLSLNLEKGRREIVSLAFGRLHIEATELVNELADTYSVERMEAVYVLPGAIETLGRFKNDGVRLALVTNGASKMQRSKLERFSLNPFFNSILIDEEFGVGKPDERIFRQALDDLRVASGEAVMVGDDLERDIGGAQAVGISGIWVDWRGRGLPNPSPVQPIRIIKSIAELL